jgi:hypothetical protein
MDLHGLNLDNTACLITLRSPWDPLPESLLANYSTLDLPYRKGVLDGALVTFVCGTTIAILLLICSRFFSFVRSLIG